MVNLALGLKRSSYNIELLVYHPQEIFFKRIIETNKIKINIITKKSGISLKFLWKISRFFRKKKYDTVVSFLIAPNFYAILGKLLSFSSVKLIVSERSSFLADSNRFFSFLIRFLYIFSETVVANSVSHANFLKRHLWLKNKVKIISNGYLPLPKPRLPNSWKSKTLRVLILGRISHVKNGVKILKALQLFKKRNGYYPLTSWAGRNEFDPKSLEMRSQMDEILKKDQELFCHWRWLGEIKSVPEQLLLCDVLLHPSKYEGLPNAICEAFLAGRAVIASNVCDHSLLIEEGNRGFLCNPNSDKSICSAIERFTKLSKAQKIEMGVRARRFAKKNLSLKLMIEKYKAIL